MTEHVIGEQTEPGPRNPVIYCDQCGTECEEMWVMARSASEGFAIARTNLNTDGSGWLCTPRGDWCPQCANVRHLSDAEALELNMPTDAWLGMEAVRDGTRFQLVDVSTDPTHQHTKWKEIRA